MSDPSSTPPSPAASNVPRSVDGLPPLRDVIARHNLRAKKSLGQNFILDLNLTCAIARAAQPLEGRDVIEVGPGPGGLTRGLLMEGAGRVIGIERDERALGALREISDHYGARVEIHCQDALKTNWRELFSPDLAQINNQARENNQVKNTKPIIVANLPYGIATKLLIDWLTVEQWPPWYDKMVLMFQKEVAQRIVAPPGSKAFGRLAVISQWRTQPRIVMNLPPEAFTPPPKVSSAVVEFIPRPTLQPACDVTTLGRVTAAAFGQRRKMLRVSLKQLVAVPELLLDKAGIDPKARAETLQIADFVNLAIALDC